VPPIEKTSDAHPTAAFDALCRHANALGLSVRGAFHPEPGEFDEWQSASPVGTIVLLGFTGSRQWPHFRSSAEAGDGLPHPLDRWSRRIIGALARDWEAVDVYPNGSPSPPPFQRLALRSEPVHQSPIGMLIHPTWGLWHAYRGALLLSDRIELPPVPSAAHPCAGCPKPCLSGCPVGAFRAGSFDVRVCIDHVRSAQGSECRERGCIARRACPVGSGFRYVEEQARFHMQAFLRSQARAP
jgi:hypothetical protein